MGAGGGGGGGGGGTAGWVWRGGASANEMTVGGAKGGAGGGAGAVLTGTLATELLVMVRVRVTAAGGMDRKLGLMFVLWSSSVQQSLHMVIMDNTASCKMDIRKKRQENRQTHIEPLTKNPIEKLAIDSSCSQTYCTIL